VIIVIGYFMPNHRLRKRSIDLQLGGRGIHKGSKCNERYNSILFWRGNPAIWPPLGHYWRPISNKILIKTIYLLPSAKGNINIPRSTPIETTADTAIIRGKTVVCVWLLLPLGGRQLRMSYKICLIINMHCIVRLIKCDTVQAGR
jgi:hypothetical protein